MRHFSRGIFASGIFFVAAFAQALQSGDIAVVGFYSDSPDKAAFVALVDIPAGTQIGFTDEGWKSSGGFRSGENHLLWTAAAGGVSAGSVIELPMSGLSNSGDQLIAYTGSPANPTLIFALNDDGSSWASNATSNSNSALPTGLTNGLTAIALNEKDNYAYTGPVTGTASPLSRTRF